MNNKRRDFLKLAGLTGLGMAGAGIIPAHAVSEDMAGRFPGYELERNHVQKFNMSGYAAPKLDTVRIGFIGTGNRGSAAVVRMSKVGGVAIKAIADLRPEKANAAKKRIAASGQDPMIYSGNKDEWKKVCEREDIELIYIATPWELHTPMAVYAMNNGKHVCVEVPAATSVEECWQLVETSERNRKHCMMLENCCYDFFEMLTLNMARQGFFGEIVHAEGAYIHDLLEGDFSKEKYYDNWRLRMDASRKGNLYPTHGLGPVCQIMNINRGDKMDFLVSVSSNDFMKKVEERIIIPTIEGLKQDNIPYKGFIFIGLMASGSAAGKEPYVIEYNVRMGDPETESVIPRIESDIIELFKGVAEENLSEKELKISPKIAATIMLVAGGYPGEYLKGKTLSGIDNLRHSVAFHAGTELENGLVKSSGGRVIAITSLQNNLFDAVQSATADAGRIYFDGRYFRADIGADLL